MENMTITQLGGYVVHPAAAAFPMMNDAELKELVEDIKKHGLRQPIVLNHDESILIDGRNRLRACEIARAETGVDHLVTTALPEMTEGEILDYVVSANLHRRHLSAGQKAMLGSKLKPMYAEAAKKRVGGRPKQGEGKPVANSPQVSERSERERKSREQAAKAVGSSGRSVSDAEALNKDAPDLAEKVTNNEMSLNAATKERKERKNRQEPKKPVPTPAAPPARSQKSREIIDLAEQGKTRKEIAQELGVGDRTVRRELEDEALVEAALAKATPLDWDSIPGNQQQKLERAKTSIRRELEKEFRTRLLAQVDQYKAECDTTLATYKAQLDEQHQKLNEMRNEERARYKEGIAVYSAKGLITPSEYKTILTCLHPDTATNTDGERAVSVEKLSEAFRLFRDSKIKTLLVKEV